MIILKPTALSSHLLEDGAMDYLTSMEMSKVWVISSRRVSLLCSEGRVAGAEKKGKTWLIPKEAKKPVQLIDEIPMNGKQDYDVLGFIYEYLISNFAANAGKKAGEFLNI